MPWTNDGGAIPPDRHTGGPPLQREPRWLLRARQDIGLREIPGRETAPTIRRWLRELRAWWDDDETPWCGVAVAAWMRDSSIDVPQHWYRARAWANWGLPLQNLALGAVAVFEREGGGHVGLVTGQRNGDPIILGGNQGNMVCERVFPRDRLLALRWPAAEMAPGSLYAVRAGSAPSTTGEA